MWSWTGNGLRGAFVGRSAECVAVLLPVAVFCLRCFACPSGGRLSESRCFCLSEWRACAWSEWRARPACPERREVQRVRSPKECVCPRSAFACPGSAFGYRRSFACPGAGGRSGCGRSSRVLCLSDLLEGYGFRQVLPYPGERRPWARRSEEEMSMRKSSSVTPVQSSRRARGRGTSWRAVNPSGVVRP